MNANICVCEGDGKFFHKLYEVCVFELYLNMWMLRDGVRHLSILTKAYMEDMNYFCFLVEAYFTTGY